MAFLHYSLSLDEMRKRILETHDPLNVESHTRAETATYPSAATLFFTRASLSVMKNTTVVRRKQAGTLHVMETRNILHKPLSSRDL